MTDRETADLRALPAGDLRRDLDESLRALFNLRFQAATRQLADVSQVRRARRRVARIRTLLRERELLGADGDAVAAAQAGAAGEPEPAASADAAGADMPDGDDMPDAAADGDGGDGERG